MLEQKIARYCKEYCPSAVAMDGWVPSIPAGRGDTNKNCGRKCSGSSERVGAFRWVRPKSEQGVPSLEASTRTKPDWPYAAPSLYKKQAFRGSESLLFGICIRKRYSISLKRPSGPRRFCAVQVFWPKATLVQAEFTSAGHVKSSRYP